MKPSTFALLSPERRYQLSQAGLRDVQVCCLPECSFVYEVERLRQERENVFIVSEHVAMRDFLGQEFDVVAFYLTEKLSLNVVFAVVSTLTSGGQLLAACTDDTRQLPSFHQALISELIHCQRKLHELSDNELQERIEQRQQALTYPPDVLSDAQEMLNSYQQIGIVAPRGYGKSYLLGRLISAFADDVCHHDDAHIYLCAPSRASANSVFRTIQGDTKFSFVPPEQLKSISDKAFVFIDEAANCPQKYIVDNFSRFRRCVLATTTDGYEGQAQGFLYQMQARNVATLTLPFCWRNAPQDFLHLWQQRYVGLVSSSQKQPLSAVREDQHPCFDLDANPDAVVYTVISSIAAMSDKARDTIIDLLATAHYRTTPNDLYQLLKEDCCYALATHHQQIVGVVVWQCERIRVDGRDIIYGIRRPSGNLLLQSLLSATAELSLASLCAARVLRIAVNPTFQQRGVGTALLETVEAHLHGDVDFLGASFSAKQESRMFWQKNNYTLLNVGLRKSPWLSTHALTMGRSLSSESAELLPKLHCKTQMLVHYYSHDFAVFSHWLHVEHDCHVDVHALCFSLLSVLEGYRDVVYVLPEMLAFTRQYSAQQDDESRAIAKENGFEIKLAQQLSVVLERVEREVFHETCHQRDQKVHNGSEGEREGGSEVEKKASRLSALQTKTAKQRVKTLLADALKDNDAITSVRTFAQEYCAR